MASSSRSCRRSRESATGFGREAADRAGLLTARVRAAARAVGALRAARAFGRALLAEAFRAGRDVRRRPPDFCELWRDFA